MPRGEQEELNNKSANVTFGQLGVGSSGTHLSLDGACFLGYQSKLEHVLPGRVILGLVLHT